MKKLQAFLIILAVAFIASCGGSDGTILDTADGGTGTGGGGADPVDPTTITVEMGSGTPPGFTSGIIDVAVPSLAAGGSTSLTVTFVTSLGALYTQEVNVTFSSACIASNLATVSGSTTTDTGVLTVTYGATGCSGDDVITATANIDGVLSATGTVTVSPSSVRTTTPTAGFVSTTP